MMELEKPWPRRAVSPFFRACGAEESQRGVEAGRWTRFPGSHRGEWRVLSLLVALVSGAAVFDGLWRVGGGWLAWCGLLPGWFLLMHVLIFALPFRRPAAQLAAWSVLLGVWACLMVAEGAGVAVTGIAWVWLGWLLVQIPAWVVLLWRRAMEVTGKSGIRVRIGILVLLHIMMAGVWWQCGWEAGVATGLAIGLLGCWGTFLPASGIFGPVATRMRGSGVLLTIDDGPDPSDTPVVLDLLDRHGCKAVFFVIGEKVGKYPELAREIVARGHELGNHTLSHPQGTMWMLGPGRTRREIEGCQRVVEEVTGVRPRWFRAPVGHRNFFTHPVAAELGLEVVAWSRRGYDTREREVATIIGEVTRGWEGGEILLLHESTPVTREVVAGVLGKLSAFRARSGGC